MIDGRNWKFSLQPPKCSKNCVIFRHVRSFFPENCEILHYLQFFLPFPFIVEKGDVIVVTPKREKCLIAN